MSKPWKTVISFLLLFSGHVKGECSFDIYLEGQAGEEQAPMLQDSNYNNIETLAYDTDYNENDLHWTIAKRVISDVTITENSYLMCQLDKPKFVEVVERNPGQPCQYSLTYYCDKYFAGDPADEYLCNYESSFSACQLNSCEWYHNGPEVDVVTDASTSVRVMSTVERLDALGGLVHYLPIACLKESDHFKISGKVKLVNETTNAPVTCEPLQEDIDGERCPRGNLLLRSIDSTESYEYDIAFTTAKVNDSGDDGWYWFWGYFIVTKEMEASESVAFFIDGPKKGVNILLDAFSIKRSDEENCIPNGDFEVGDTRHWGCYGPRCEVELRKYGYDGGKYSIATKTRDKRFWGLVFDVEEDCFAPNKLYEVQAYFQMEDENGQAVDCDPFVYYQGLSSYCPDILIKKENQQNVYEQIRAAGTVGPFKKGQGVWNKMYGYIDGKEASIFLQWNDVQAYIGSARAGVNIVVDNLSIQEVGYDYCSTNLILNGDAEFGDARFWYIRGSKDLGTIEMVEPGADNTAYGFSHVGKRGNRNTGIWQELPKRCIGFNTRWEISAQFKIPYACSKPSGKENGGYGNGYSNYDGDNGDSTCPIFRLEAYDKSGENLMDFYVQNQDESEWIQNRWNTFRAFFTMDDPSFHARERLFIMAVVPVGQTYQIDSISFTLSPTAYPSVPPSFQPSAYPTTVYPTTAPSTPASYMLIGSTPLRTEDIFIGSVISSPEYTITFTLRPLGIKDTWSNLFRFTNTTSDLDHQHGNRCPYLSFSPNSCILHLGHNLKNGEGVFKDMGEELNQNQDYEIKIIGIGDSLQLYVDDIYIDELSIPLSDRVFNELQVYTGQSDRHYGANAEISNLAYQPTTSLSPSMLIGSIPLQTGNILIGSIISGTEYTITFTLRPLGIKNDWGNILRFANTTSENYQYGDRSPALYFSPNTNILHLSYFMKNDVNNHKTMGEELNQNQDYEIKITGIGDSLTLYVDDIYRDELSIPLSERFFSELQVYIGQTDRHYGANVEISNLVYQVL